ncbi:MAG: dockerin type I repeat-containing protein [Muribaculaceae bacterium]|nr:dockerin type I repeat-containing protein [Muribaculaceae bacterium]
MIKKLLSLTAILLVSVPTILAQTFEFRYHGESLADGAIVTIQAEEDEWGFGEMGCYTNPSSDPSNGLILKLLSGNTAQGSATMTIDENNFNPSRILWCMGGNCMNFGSNTTITKPFTVNNGLCLVQFDAEDIQSEGYLLATLTATIGSETHTVKIKFVNGDVVDVIPGDVNGDGTVGSVDVTILYNYLLNGDGGNMVNGDQDGDGIITAGDITVIYNILLN